MPASRFASTVARLLARQGRDTLARLRKNPLAPPPRYTAQIQVWADALAPLLAKYYDAGGRRCIARLNSRLEKASEKVRHPVQREHDGDGQGNGRSATAGRGVPERPGDSRYIAGPRHQPVGVGRGLAGAAIRDEGRGQAGAVQTPTLKSRKRLLWKLLHPRVQEAIRRQAFTFIRETFGYSWRAVGQAQRKFRQELNEGLAEGESLTKLVDRVAPLFGRDRGYTIARTESNRAVSAADVIAAEESGVCTGTEWICSPEACQLCQSVNHKRVKFGEPFIVLPGGGQYSVVMHPPMHPSCTCATKSILNQQYAEPGTKPVKR